MWDGIKAVWLTLNGPDNDEIVVALIIALGILLYNNIKSFFEYRARLRDKDKAIEDLVQQRNLFQDKVLNPTNIQRKSSKKGGKR